MELERKILTGSTFIFTSRIINWISLVIFSITMARLLGRDIYGLISIAIGFMGLFAIIGDLGLNVAGVRYISMYFAKKKYQDIRTIVRMSLMVKSLLAIILAIICFLGAELFAQFFKKDLAPLFEFVAIIIICNILASVFQSVMKGLQRMDLFAMSNIFRDVSWIIISIGLVLNGWGIIGAMWGYLISAFIWIIICISIYLYPLRGDISRTQESKQKLRKSIIKKLVVFGMPIAIMDITVLLYNWTDTFVLAYFHPTWEVSCYNIAFGLVNMVMLIIASVSATLFPIFSHEQALKNDKTQKKIYEKVVKIVIIIIYPLLTFMIFLAPYLILIYGSEYLPAVLPLYILVLWGFFRPVGNIGGGLLTAKGRQVLVMKITLGMALLNFILNILLIPPYHMMGAAVATTIAFIIGSIVTYYILLKDYNVELSSVAIGKSLGAAIISGAIGLGIYLALDLISVANGHYISLLLLILKLFSAFLIAGIVYLLLLRLLQIFSRDDIRILDRLAKEYRIVQLVRRILVR